MIIDKFSKDEMKELAFLLLKRLSPEEREELMNCPCLNEGKGAQESTAHF